MYWGVGEGQLAGLSPAWAIRLSVQLSVAQYWTESGDVLPAGCSNPDYWTLVIARSVNCGDSLVLIFVRIARSLQETIKFLASWTGQDINGRCELIPRRCHGGFASHCAINTLSSDGIRTGKLRRCAPLQISRRCKANSSTPFATDPNKQCTILVVRIIGIQISSKKTLGKRKQSFCLPACLFALCDGCECIILALESSRTHAWSTVPAEHGKKLSPHWRMMVLIIFCTNESQTGKTYGARCDCGYTDMEKLGYKKLL
ncbi:hypothetical protein PoB_000822400 [Plakobranchus ocellatus]|uniref:Uncharacterized protein n=1 Tax=Plakobranchus ocellatus TaxID=259542 RepID=A0AAV3YFE9_9GAST|nr:hypothetical protein PoB_000822400 [Plakobranchus ocellatus]